MKKRKNSKKVCDLHTHSYYSDGEFSPKELVKKAKKKGIKVLALTDHNSVKGVQQAINQAKRSGITIIPGVEIEVGVKHGEVLGYFIDYKNKKLHEELKNLSRYVDKGVHTRIKALQKLNANISVSKFEKLYPHAKNNYKYANLTNYFLGHLKMSKKQYYDLLDKIKKPKPKKKQLSLVEAIKLIKKYNGVPVLSHPWLGEHNKKYVFNEKFIKNLINAGLQGLEIDNHEGYNFGRTKEFIKKIRYFAKKYNLILTSGSDFHGPVLEKLTKHHKLGKSKCSLEVVEQLKKLKEKNKIKAIIFDIGEVLYDESMNFLLDKEVSESFNFSYEKLKKAREKYLNKAQTGKLSIKEYPKLVAKELHIKDKNKFTKLWIKLRTNAITFNKNVEKTIKKLKKNYLIGTLTNITKINHRIRIKKNAYKHFKLKLISCNEGLRKPNLNFYKLLIKKTKLKPEEIIFIDDAEENIIPAKKLGIKTTLFKNNSQLIKELKRVGVKV
jgi:epoxide hydrolase-like predicted phosphatase